MSDDSRVKTLSTTSKIPIRKLTQRKEVKILTPKEMLQRLPITLAQVNEGNTSENLLNKIC